MLLAPVLAVMNDPVHARRGVPPVGMADRQWRSDMRKLLLLGTAASCTIVCPAVFATAQKISPIYVEGVPSTPVTVVSANVRLATAALEDGADFVVLAQPISATMSTGGPPLHPPPLRAIVNGHNVQPRPDKLSAFVGTELPTDRTREVERLYRLLLGSSHTGSQYSASPNSPAVARNGHENLEDVSHAGTSGKAPG
jgi:hypothetical protein